MSKAEHLPGAGLVLLSLLAIAAANTAYSGVLPSPQSWWQAVEPANANKDIKPIIIVQSDRSRQQLQPELASHYPSSPWLYVASKQQQEQLPAARPQAALYPQNFENIGYVAGGGLPAIFIVKPTGTQTPLGLSPSAAVAAAAPTASGQPRDNLVASQQAELLKLASLLQALDGTQDMNNLSAAVPPPLPAAVISDPNAAFKVESSAVPQLAAATQAPPPAALLSLLGQSQRLKRVQEAVAGFYLRNYESHRK